MESRSILADIGKLIWRTDFGSLKALVEELDNKYPGFLKAFQKEGTILTKDRIAIIHFLKEMYRKEKLGLFAILAPFGFGKTVVIEKIIKLIEEGEIRYGKQSIRPVHIRLNIQTDRGKIVSKFLEDLGVTSEEDILRIIYEGIKKDALIQKASEEDVISWLRESILGGATTLDLLLNRASNEELIRLLEKVIESYEKITDSKVVLIFDEVEHSLKGFSPDFLYFLAMLIRYCFEREHREFVGTIAMTTSMVEEEQASLFLMLKEMGAGDVRDRIRERHISRELRLTPETATELMSKILRFYLYFLVDVSKNKKWKNILDQNNSYGDKLYTYPLDYDLLKYLSYRGLRRTLDTGVILDFRAYLTLVGATLDAWISRMLEKKLSFDEMIEKKEALDIRKFWELNDDIRRQSDIQQFLRTGEIYYTIFRRDVIEYVENQICSKIDKPLFQKVVLQVVLNAIRTRKEQFSEKELMEDFNLKEEALEDFRKSLPEESKHIISFEYGNLIIDLQKLQDEIVGTEEATRPDPDMEKIKAYLNTEIDGKLLTETDVLLLLRRWKVEKTGEWSVDEKDKDILVERTSKPWNTVLYVTGDPNKEAEIRDRVTRSGRLDVGFIVSLRSEPIFKVVYPPGLQAQEKHAKDKIDEMVNNIISKRDYKELAQKIDSVVSDLDKSKRFYLITLILPIFYRALDITDYPLEFNQVDLWADIEYFLKNPPSKYQDRWIESKTGIMPSPQFKEVVSSLLKLVLAYGSEIDFKGYDRLEVWQHERVKYFDNVMENLGFQKDWMEAPLAASSFLDRISKTYASILPYDESTRKLKGKDLLPKSLENALKWLKEEVEKKESLSLSDVSKHFFGVEVKENGKVSWNVPSKAKRAILLVLALSNYYGDTHIDKKDGKLLIFDPSQVVDLQAQKIKSELIRFARYIIANKLITGKDMKIAGPRKFWQTLNNIIQDKKTKPKQKSQFLRDLLAKISKEGPKEPIIEVRVKEDDIRKRIEKIMKSTIVEKEFRGVGQYLKEVKSCIDVRQPERNVIVNFLDDLVKQVELDEAVLQANRRMNKVIENLGNLTKKKPKELEPKVLKSLEKLNQELIKKNGEEWSQVFKKDLSETIAQNCEDMYESGKIDVEQTYEKIREIIPNLQSEFTKEQKEKIETSIESLKESFRSRAEKLEKSLKNWKIKCTQLSGKSYVAENLRAQLNETKIKIAKQLSVFDVDPEVNFVESLIEESQNLIKEARSNYQKVIKSLGDKNEIKLLELCDKYDYNIVAILKEEFNTDIRTIITVKKPTKKQCEARIFLLNILKLGVKHKLPLKLAW
jgi:hypothetical protein